MQYGVMNYPGAPIIQEIKRIAGIGVDYIELTMDPPCAHYSQLCAQKAEILRLLNDCGLAMVCHLPTFVYSADLTESLRNASVSELIFSLETAAELNADKVVLHPGTPVGMGCYFPDLVKRLAFESLCVVLEHARNLRLCVCIENMPANCEVFTEPDEFAAIFDQFPDVYMTFDVGHANTRNKKPGRIVEFIERFGPRIKHLHISDNQGEKDEHLPLGKGVVDLKKTALALKKADYQHTITFEIFTGEPGDVIASINFFRRLLER